MALVEFDVEITGTETSPRSHVSVPPVVAPDPTVLRYTRRVVATELTAAAEATVLNLTLSTKLPFAPAVKALKMFVPMVSVPSERTSAAVVVIFALPMFGVSVKMGEVFAGIYYIKYDTLLIATSNPMTFDTVVMLYSVEPVLQ